MRQRPAPSSPPWRWRRGEPATQRAQENALNHNMDIGIDIDVDTWLH